MSDNPTGRIGPKIDKTALAQAAFRHDGKPAPKGAEPKDKAKSKPKQKIRNAKRR